MTIRKLYSGDYECTNCGQLFTIHREIDAECPSCAGKLEEVDLDEEEDEEEAEE